MSHVTTTEDLFRCPKCGQPVISEATYEVTPEPLAYAHDQPAPMIESLRGFGGKLVGVKIDHACGTAAKTGILRGGVIGTVSAGAGGNTGGTPVRVHDPRCRLPRDHSEPCSW